MKIWKKAWSFGLAAAMIFSLSACGGQKDVSPAPTEEQGVEEPVTMNVAALKGPTAMGLVKLMSDAENGGEAYGAYDFTLAASADEVSPRLLQGELDVACVPANLAAVLYQKSEGAVVTVAINTLGVIYVVETGDTVQSMADLKGKTIVGAGKGSTPEFALRYLLTENGVDPDTEVDLQWKSEHAECVAALASGQATIALLPQPFVTAAGAKVEGLRTALDLTEEWDKLDNGSAMLTGVAVARKEFVEAHPQAMARFLEGYAASVAWVNENNEEAAELIAQYGIIEAAPVAQKALPHCNIVCITGAEMKEKLSGYLGVLFEQAPQSVGGALPGDDFYYGA